MDANIDKINESTLFSYFSYCLTVYLVRNDKKGLFYKN